MSRIRKDLGVELELRTLFESPTIAGLAEQIKGELSAVRSVAQLPVVPISRDRALALSFAQQRLWILNQL
jgi:hypothetical protein